MNRLEDLVGTVFRLIHAQGPDCSAPQQFRLRMPNLEGEKMEMSHEQVEKQIARKSALIYIPISLGAALIFLLLSLLTGNYSLVARIGGMVWVALLSLIVSMPVVISRVKKEYQSHEEQPK